MSKIDTAKRLLKLAGGNPGTYVRAAKYAAKYGLVGLRDRFHQEIVLNDVATVNDTAPAGSVNGTIRFSVLMPVYNVNISLLEKAVDSVSQQSYANWELCIADDASTDSEVASYLKEVSNRDDRIRFVRLSSNQGISAATNAAAKLASGDYYVLMDNDDELAPSALFELYLTASTTQADIIYSDNDVISENGERLSVLHKPDWSPDLMLSQMYVGHLLAFTKELFELVGGFRTEFNGSQDYDLFLRMLAHSDNIEHISKVLYSWRAIPTSTACNADAKPYAQTAGQKAVQAYLDAKYGLNYCMVRETSNLFVYDVRYPVPDGTKASIIIPTKDHIDDLDKALNSIFQNTAFSSYEILVINNQSSDPATIDYFNQLESEHSNLRVLDAPYGFNWSKLNNQGIREASGDVFVFLNNDVEVLSPDWLTRLVENALRDDIGVAGGLLLYPDGSIQHAGVVIGMGGWADHVYKGEQPVHHGDPFISPMVTRNVSSVTGACMAISRKTISELGGFDENFIVCGSDTEMCIRALRAGYNNIYLPDVRLMHYESKTRDVRDIPEIDFKLSEAMYRGYVSTGDPYYNRNLDYMSTSPRVLSQKERLMRGAKDDMWVSINEIRPLQFKPDTKNSVLRINLLVPSVNPEDIFGGISTALSFFERLVSKQKANARIIVLDAEPRMGDLPDRFSAYKQVALGEESSLPLQIVPAFNRDRQELPVSDEDVFIATSWWSAYCYQDEYLRQRSLGQLTLQHPLVYLIQDYEPGFYAWSSRYLLAQSTYQSDVPTVAVFNSRELHWHFIDEGLRFEHEFEFDPFLNKALADALANHNGIVAKRRQILVYGRPGTDRNAFELVVESLKRWIDDDDSSCQWEFFSAGELHAPVRLAKGRYLTSVGKLSLSDYAALLAESYAGISLMVSPHPSYPPLEMASFGVKVITNCYGRKDLSSFSPNITSLKRATPYEIAHALGEICSSYSAEVSCGEVSGSYLGGGDQFGFLDELIRVIH